MLSHVLSRVPGELAQEQTTRTPHALSNVQERVHYSSCGVIGDAEEFHDSKTASYPKAFSHRGR